MARYLDAAFLIKAGSAGVAFCAAVYTFFLTGPALETRFLPVIDNFQILSIIPVDDESTRLTVAFRKARACEYIGIAWFRGLQTETFERVSIVLLRNPDDTGSPNRPLGWQRAGPWIIGVPDDDVREKSFAEVMHTCHPFWVTRTHLFP